MGETVLRDLVASDERWKVATLRYFNPVGAHESGLIGEDPRGTPNNLMPYVAQVAVGRRTHLQVFGDDYDTADGTGVRDYIHVSDLADGHVAALRYLFDADRSLTVNLGTGHGYSVLDVVRAYALASGRDIPYRVGPRRPGDVAACYADPTRAAQLLGWRASLGLDRMCADSWRWQRMNPNGFETPLAEPEARAATLAVRSTFPQFIPFEIPEMSPIDLQPVIIAGGSGTRLWPLSRSTYPKQFLALHGRHSLFQQAALRLRRAGRAGHRDRRPLRGRQRGPSLPGARPAGGLEAAAGHAAAGADRAQHRAGHDAGRAGCHAARRAIRCWW